MKKESAQYSQAVEGSAIVDAQNRRITGPIVLACDGAYAMPLATTLRSLAEANRKSWPLQVYVLCDGMSDELRERVVKSLPIGAVALAWIPVELELFEGFAVTAHVSRMTYARLLLPRLFPNNAGKVLFLDTDILILDDLSALWETDLGGAVAGAVSDTIDSLLKDGDPRLTTVPRVRSYFNAGIMLIDLDRWRSERISEKALEYLAENPDAPYWDQDAINVACDGRWKRLEPRWNFQNHRRTSISGLHPAERPAIVHFVTGDKPWNFNVPNLNAAFYDAFRNRTEFARTPVGRWEDFARASWARLKRFVKACCGSGGRGHGQHAAGSTRKPVSLQSTQR